MGNHRFRLSDMLPNAWFYKLRDMSRLKNLPHHKIANKKSSSSSPSPSEKNHPSKITKLPHLSDQRKSYYITRDLTTPTTPNSPLKTTTTISVSDKHDLPSSVSRRRRSIKRSRLHKIQPADHPPPRLVSSSSSISAGCNCRATLQSVVWSKPPPMEADSRSSSDDHGSTLTEYGSDRGLIPDDPIDDVIPESCKCRTGNDAVGITTDADDDKIRVSDFDQRDLPPIITKKQPAAVRIGPVKRLSGNSPSLSPGGVKLRTNTPRIANLRIQGRKSASSSRRSVSESFAVVKSSKDPGRDFKESMVEMIVENNIRASKDLEELLACYLSLNSDEYHELIINVFKQIWFDFVRFRLKS